MKRFTCLAGILLLFVSSPVSRSQDASRVIANPIDIDYAFTRRTTGFYDWFRVDAFNESGVTPGRRAIQR